MKFIDEASIAVRAGKGGAGSRSFRREKFVPLGGPDGGNGGAGGSVIVKAERQKTTLLDFQFQPQWDAQNGAAGSGSRKDGKSGDTLIIPVPIGTQVFDAESDELIADLCEDGQEVIVAQGGRGGKGNTFFKSATNRAPDHAQPGEEGQSKKLRFSLKLVADVGLVGFPNAGKSTLISRISAARPKIADYPFTTLTPNLGVVRAKGGASFVVADIPGLIEGAHEGRGLGIQFLKHIERTKVIAHLIDPFMLDEHGERINPMHAYHTIQNELRSFAEEIAQKPQIVVITKADSITDPSELDETIKALSELGVPVMIISSVSGVGIEELVERLSREVHSLRGGSI